MYYRNIYSNLISYSFGHFLIDALGTSLLINLCLSKTSDPTLIGLFVLIYNCLAFGLQPIIGLISDKYNCAKHFAIIGLLLMGIALIVGLYLPILSIIFAGIANAFFHIGGGTIILNFSNGKATFPGIFVAPGAIGLLFGAFMGFKGYFFPFLFLAITLISSIIIFFIDHPKINTIKKAKNNYLELIVLLLLITIVFRSIVGMALVFPWKNVHYLLIILTISIFLGKALGGYFADKFGFLNTAIFSLIVSVPLLTYGINYPILGIIGIFFFNITMPITLVAISNTLPGYPGFSFGLTCLALIIGAIITFTSFKSFLSNNYIIFIMIVISIITIYFGLKLYNRNRRITWI